MLTDQKTDIKGFADFMQKLSTVKEHVPNLEEKVEYIKNLYEVGANGFKPVLCLSASVGAMWLHRKLNHLTYCPINLLQELFFPIHG